MSDPTDPPIQSQEYPELLDIQPSSFRVDLLLHTDIFLDLHLTNLTSNLVTFKVKTTARDRYQLKPTQGYIPPNSTKQCKIVLSALSTYPDASNSKNVRDKFLVQSITIAGEVDDLSRFWKEREMRHAVKDGRYAYAEQIVKCKLNVPLVGGGSGGGDSPSRVDRDEREERREEAGAAGGGGGGAGVIVVDEVKEQQQSGQKQQPIASTTSNTNNSSFTSTQQRLSYPPAISITSTPTQPTISNVSVGAAPHTTTASSASFSATSHPSHQHDNATTHPTSSTANNHSSNSGGSTGAPGSSSGGRGKEYNDLMEFTVRLTAQMEREKADAAIIADKYNKALAHIAQLQKRLAVLTAQQQRDRNSAATGEAGERGEEEKGKSASLSAAGGSGEGKEEKPNTVEKASSSGSLAGTSASSGSSGAVGMRERLMSGDGVRNNSGGFTWQIYQIILVAIIAFVLGRLLSK